jgi:hypothetical protein
VKFEPRGPIEVQGVRYPPAVLISFEPDNPALASPEVGFTNAARIYRKPAEASDSEYIEVTDGMIAPPTPEQINAILQRYNAQSGPAPEEAAPTTGPTVPEAAPRIGPAGRGAPVATPYPPGSFVYLDNSVDEGESYIYKILTYSTGQDAEATPTVSPYISSSQAVPALVEFTVTSVLPNRVSFSLTRRDPETNRPIEQRITVSPGMPIGGMVRIPFTRRVDSGIERGYKDVDFSTNCILVDAIQFYPDIQYTIATDRTGKITYKVRERNNGRILYLTPRGSLRMKERERR